MRKLFRVRRPMPNHRKTCRMEFRMIRGLMYRRNNWSHPLFFLFRR